MVRFIIREVIGERRAENVAARLDVAVKSSFAALNLAVS